MLEPFDIEQVNPIKRERPPMDVRLVLRNSGSLLLSLESPLPCRKSVSSPTIAPRAISSPAMRHGNSPLPVDESLLDRLADWAGRFEACDPSDFEDIGGQRFDFVAFATEGLDIARAVKRALPTGPFFTGMILWTGSSGATRAVTNHPVRSMK
ncbi:MAG: hypothetical protein HWD60_08310 [Defluviicoccus sp.]|nr:MAG: hypothetical protein HWD60_08310 [Defluviicoccus sp.]